MAGKCKYSEKDTLFVGRFVYDVLEYTLPKCGFPKTKLPNIDCADNVYHRDQFVKITGASALRVSLLMREKWRQTFISQRNSIKSKSENVSLLLAKLATSCALSRTRTTQSTVELLLASCNEVLLFLHHEGIDIDVIKVMKSVGSYILLMSGTGQNLSERIEGLFDEFDNIWLFTKSLSSFIKKYAIPYGSRDDVSNLFLERVKKRFIDLRKASPSWILSINIVKYHLGYLPCDLVSAVVDGESVPSDNLPLTSNTTSSIDCKSQMTNMSDDSEICVLRGSKSSNRRSIGPRDISKKTAKSEQSSQNSSELGIEKDLEKISLTAEGASQTSHGTMLKRKKSRKKSENLELASSLILQDDSKSQKPTELPDASESGVFREKSLERHLNGSGNVSEQTAKSVQSSKNSPQFGTEDDFEQGNLITEGASQTSHGAIPKRKTSTKKKGKK